MFKATIPTESQLRRKRLSELQYGEIARITAPIYTGEVVMCVGPDLVINLSKVGPGHIWTGIKFNTLEVELLPVGTKITIEVTE